MSYTTPIGISRQQIKRQQEKLRIARQALARAEAKYARKLLRQRPVEPPAQIGARRSRPDR
jgi:hypothetical protein